MYATIMKTPDNQWVLHFFDKAERKPKNLTVTVRGRRKRHIKRYFRLITGYKGTIHRLPFAYQRDW